MAVSAIPEKKENFFESPVIRIKGNALSCKNSFIQISNITQVWNEKIRKAPLNTRAIFSSILFAFLLFVGAIILFASSGGSRSSYSRSSSSDSAGMVALGVFLLLLSILFVVIAILIFRSYAKQPQWYGLNLTLNSRESFSYASMNESYVLRAYNTLYSIIEERNFSANYTMNLADGTFVFGDNSGNIGNNNIIKAG